MVIFSWLYEGADGKMVVVSINGVKSGAFSLKKNKTGDSYRYAHLMALTSILVSKSV